MKKFIFIITAVFLLTGCMNNANTKSSQSIGLRNLDWEAGYDVGYKEGYQEGYRKGLID